MCALLFLSLLTWLSATHHDKHSFLTEKGTPLRDTHPKAHSQWHLLPLPGLLGKKWESPWGCGSWEVTFLFLYSHPYDHSSVPLVPVFISFLVPRWEIALSSQGPFWFLLTKEWSWKEVEVVRCKLPGDRYSVERTSSSAPATFSHFRFSAWQMGNYFFWKNNCDLLYSQKSILRAPVDCNSG